MSDRDADELEKFKSTIDLRVYAATQGWEQDAGESGQGSAVMRHPNGDKIVITRDEDGHYVYYSVRDDRDNGTIIDFIQFRHPGLTLGEVRKELRKWVEMSGGQTPVLVLPPLQKVPKDRAQDAAELEKFKSAIDLRVYAETQGWAQDTGESWRGSAVMRHSNGDKIVITRDEDGHYVYFSVRDDRDHGSIIDFIQSRHPGLNLGEVRKEIRKWTGSSGEPIPAPASPPLQKATKDRERVQSEYARMKDALRHPYLEEERGIPAALLSSPRFKGMIRIDHRGNAIFPHSDEDGLCGFEIKNRGFTSFSAGGAKGLWLSDSRPDDDCLVVCESSIDCLSHATLFPNPHARYASLGGQVSLPQRKLLRLEIARMPTGAEIRAAMDADEGGRSLTEVVRRAFLLAGRDDLTLWEDVPAKHKDWNDALRVSRDDPLAELDPDSRSEIEKFIRVMGATVTHVGERGAPDPRMPPDATSWAQWRRRHGLSVDGPPSVRPASRNPLNPETRIAFIRDWGQTCARAGNWKNSQYRGDPDVLLPQRRWREIEVEGYQPFMGRWLGDYLDLETGQRYSIGEARRDLRGRFFVLRLDDSNRCVNLEWFPDAQAVDASVLPAELKHAKTVMPARIEPDLKTEKAPAPPDSRRVGEAYAVHRCPKCGSRQWVRTTKAAEWVCYECPNPDGTRIVPNDVMEWCFITLPGAEAPNRPLKLAAGNFVPVPAGAFR